MIRETEKCVFFIEKVYLKTVFMVKENRSNIEYFLKDLHNSYLI